MPGQALNNCSTFLPVILWQSLPFLCPPPQKTDKAANISLAAALWSWILIILCSPRLATHLHVYCKCHRRDKWENKNPSS